MPMTRLLISQAGNNQQERDPRRRTVIPVRHGIRGIMEMSPVRKMAADITSLLLLADLDLLTFLDKRFEQIAIPWSTMELLLVENQSCRFHQPSRIAGAKKLRDLIVGGTLHTLTSSREPPLGLVQEVGQELAELLHSAKQSGGRVVRPLPIHRIQPFMEQEADLLRILSPAGEGQVSHSPAMPISFAIGKRDRVGLFARSGLFPLGKTSRGTRQRRR
jgi:hypothetical protein